MLLIRIASTNVLLLLTVLIAKVYCQLGQRFGPTLHENQNQGNTDIAGLVHKLSGRQQNPRFDLIPYNLRNANNPPPPPNPPATTQPQGGTDLKIKVGTVDQNKPPQGPPTAPGTSGQGGSQPPPASPPSASPPSASSSPTTKAPETPSKSGGSSDLSAPSSGNGAENDEKLHGLQKLIQELYVAQAQVQLEATEIQRAQSIAATAQQSLEEAANNVRMITAALHAAQQTVASAAIRAQTAQLQLAAHDQLLFAARQKVDALSSQIVSMQAEEGIQPTKMIVDLQTLLSKLKEPLDDKQKPTPVPSILGDISKPAAGAGESRLDGKIIHSVPSEIDGENTLNIINFLRKKQQQQQQQADNNQYDQNESLESLLARSNDLIHYGESLLQDNSEIPYESNEDEGLTDEELKKELRGLDQNEVKSLINFIVSLEHKQDTFNDKQLRNTEMENHYSLSPSMDHLKGIDRKIVEKSSDQKYMNDFLEAIKTSKIERLLSDNDAKLNDYRYKLEDNKFKKRNAAKTSESDYVDNLESNLFKERRAVQNVDSGSFDDVEPKESDDSDHIFNMENALYIDSENFKDSQP